MTELAIVGGVLLAFVLLVGALVWGARRQGVSDATSDAFKKVAEIANAQRDAAVRADPDVERVLRTGGF